MEQRIIQKAWDTFELREVCERLGLHPNRKGKLTQKFAEGKSK